MKTTLLLMSVLILSASSLNVNAQSIDEINADIERKKLENLQREAKNPAMEMEQGREPTEAEKQMANLLEMRQIFDQLDYVRTKASKPATNSSMTQIILDNNKPVEQKMRELMKIAKEAEIKKEERNAEIEQLRKEKERLESLAASIKNAPAQSEQKETPKAAPKVQVIHEIIPTFVRQFKDGKPTKVGFIVGNQTGFQGYVGSTVNKQMNGKSYVLEAVDQVGFSERVPDRPLFKITLAANNGERINLYYE